LIDENKQLIKDKDDEMHRLRKENGEMKNLKLGKLEANEAMLNEYRENMNVGLLCAMFKMFKFLKLNILSETRTGNKQAD
jgi:hypothetical protein